MEAAQIYQEKKQFKKAEKAAAKADKLGDSSSSADRLIVRQGRGLCKKLPDGAATLSD